MYSLPVGFYLLSYIQKCYLCPLLCCLSRFALQPFVSTVNKYFLFCSFLCGCLPPGVLRDSGGEQLSSPEGAAREAEGDRLPEEEAGGEGEGHPATGEAYQVSGHAQTHTTT